MIYYSALATISGIYSDTFKGVVDHMKDIENHIALQASKRGDVFTLEIQELVTANNTEALAEKEYSF